MILGSVLFILWLLIVCYTKSQVGIYGVVVDTLDSI